VQSHAEIIRGRNRAHAIQSQAMPRRSKVQVQSSFEVVSEQNVWFKKQTNGYATQMLNVLERCLVG